MHKQLSICSDKLRSQLQATRHNAKTHHFDLHPMRWRTDLRIHAMARNLGATSSEISILDAENPLNDQSGFAAIIQQILNHCAQLDLPLGLNVESLTNRKEEIDASILLFRLLKATMDCT